jgi:predicted methyltransferase
MCVSSSVDSLNSQLQRATTTTLDTAIAGPRRSDKARARDVYRHPRETLLFFDLDPTQKALEIEPGSGWYTDILAPYLHDAGLFCEAQYLSKSADLAAEDNETDATYRRKHAGCASSL